MTIQEIQEKRAQRLNEAIIASKLSYSELEKISGVPKSNIQRYATGETKKIPIDYLEALAAAVHVDAEYLLCCDEEDKPVPSEEDNELVKVVKELNAEFNYNPSQINQIARYMRFVATEDSGKE